MDADEFQKDFLEGVKITAETQGGGSSAAFVNEFTDKLIEIEVLSDFTQCFFQGTGKNKRIIRADGYSFDELDSTFNLIIANYSGSEKRDVLTRTEANHLFDRLTYFLDETYHGKLYSEIEPSTPASDLIDYLRSKKNAIRKYRFFLLTDGSISERITSVDSREIEGIPVDAQIWDIDRLFKVCGSELGRQSIEIDFTAYMPNGIPCLEAEGTTSEDYRSLLCIIPGSALADIYDSYGNQLLEGNVRSFLSTKVSVNKKIRETILSMPDKFFAYNNGIAATAAEIKIAQTSEGDCIVYAKDFQIINGGQTTASLSNTRFKDKADLSKIYVQMKLTEIGSYTDETTDLIRNISRSSNSQNKVSDADFFSTHLFHVRMEQISLKLYAPAVGGAQYETKWFYERARGQYLQFQMRMTKGEKAKFTLQHPKHQVITKTDLAKYRNSWAEKPHYVSRGAQTNFINFAETIDDEWEKSDSNFNDLYFKESVSIAIRFKATEKLITRQPWYESGYRANIVTYSIAWLHHLIQKQFPGYKLNLNTIWNKQTVGQEIEQALIQLSKLVLESITDPDRETMNVTQWCKREACWDRIKKLKYKLPEDIMVALIDIDSVVASARDAKRDQRMITEIQAETKVVELGSDYWRKLEEFAKTKHLLSPDSDTALKIAVQIPSKLPTPLQCQKLLTLLEISEAEGFKG
ncbi:MAG: AIPR family protein [Chloroflexota bacterium]